MKLYIKPSIEMLAVHPGMLASSFEDSQISGADAMSKRHNSNDFWSDMESTSSSWPKSKSVWDD